MSSGCCPSPVTAAEAGSTHTIAEHIETPTGSVPRVSTELSFRDRLGALRMRLNLWRMDYHVPPGLYGVGTPDADSPVFVSANYKLSFDHLRRELKNINGWILVLDTNGINVWCAAGKGTFGTEEIVHQVEKTKLAHCVTHGTLILPQLGAPGVSAHQVKKQCGFKIRYGPVRADDIPAFLEAGGVATEAMRRVRFRFLDRLVLVPVELVTWSSYIIFAMAFMIILAGIHGGGYSTAVAADQGIPAVLYILLGFISGGVLTPLLLPWIPGRRFALKGALVGLVVSVPLLIPAGVEVSAVYIAAWLLMVPAISSFIAMNFTGASTYTSMSGVLKEMQSAVPVQIIAIFLGVGLWITSHFI